MSNMETVVRLDDRKLAATDAVISSRETQRQLLQEFRKHGRLPPGTDPAALQGAHLIGEDLSGLNLSSLDLSGADLSRADLSGTSLVGTTLCNAVLFEANLNGSELLSADLRGANLSSCTAHNAGFESANLGGASLFSASLTGAVFTRASLQDADLRATNMNKCRLREVVLDRADLAKSKLREADLEGSNVTGANFVDVDISYARLRGLSGYATANWIGADVHGVNFTGSYLTRRTIMDQNYLHEFRTLSRTNALVYWIWWATSDCGRSFLRWGAWILLLVTLFAGLAGFVAVDYGDYPTGLSSFYYSVVTLTTLGYGDVVPASTAAQVLAIVEVVIGYVMLGGLLSIFANKMARRAD